MKLKRMIASVLALLLVVSILPIGALAADDNKAGQTVSEIEAGDTMNRNKGTVTTNNGTLNQNRGTVTTNNGYLDQNWDTVTTNNGPLRDNRGTVTTNDGTVRCNLGLVETNRENVNVNSYIVTTNEGKVLTNGPKGTVTTNKKDVTYNKGNVETNAETGKVENNWGKITTNNGTVNTNKTIKEEGVEFKGVIETNNGTVKTNDEGGTVGKKDAGTGEIVAGTGNNGTIETNSGTVISNNKNGTVEKNLAEGTIEVNAGTVGKENEEGNPSYGYGNFGAVNTNTGDIIVNYNQVGTNAAGGKITDNSGNVDANEKDAVVVENYGTIGANSGTVVYNADEQYAYNGSDWVGRGTPAVVHNLAGGEVVENYGIVNNEAGGLLNDMILSENSGSEETVFTTGYDPFKGEEGTYVGTWVHRGSIQNEDGTTEEFQDGGVYTVLKQAILNTVMDLKEVGNLFKKDGYEVIGYTTKTDKTEEDGPAEAFMALDDELDDDGEKPEVVTVYSTDYEVKEPLGWLRLIWSKIKPAAPSGDPEPKTVRNNIPTTLSADQVKIGAYVRRGNLLFRIIEVGDDSIRVATVPKLSEKSLSDMLGFLKQHLSAAQIAKINGEPKLLEQELVTQFFGDTIDHISFYAAADLFE